MSFGLDGTVDVGIDIANFHHRESGMEPSVFGLSDAMSRWTALKWLQGMLLVSSLLLLASYGLVVFLYRPRERASLYFGVTCLLLLPFAAQSSNDDLIMLAAPGMTLNSLLAWEYLTSAAAVNVALAYVRALFPRETPAWPYWILQAVGAARVAVYGAIVLTGDTVLLSRVSQYASALRTVTFVCMLLVVVWACFAGAGALVFLFGLGSFVSP